MMAEGGPPQIDWQDAVIVSNDVLARGTNQLRIKASSAVDYKPGHILGFEMAHPETGEGLKGPYTVTRSTDSEFDIIYRVIPDGRKTPFMEKLSEGDPVRFGGRFGTPVAEGIASDCDRVVGIATGAGLGPLVGYAEAALSDADGPSVEVSAMGFQPAPLLRLPLGCCYRSSGALTAARSYPAFAALLRLPRPAGRLLERGGGGAAAAAPRALQVDANHLQAHGTYAGDRAWTPRLSALCDLPRRRC